MTEIRRFRVIEAFSGVGSQRMALTRLSEKHPELQFEFVAQMDIDKYAVKSYNAIHGETPNLGDITKVEKLPDCDIFTWSFPCQDLSNAGLQKGMEEGSGTRSALCWEVVRLLTVSHRPEWLLMENVPMVVAKKNKPEFDRLCGSLEQLGYTNRYQILNAVDYNIAQNRKRCFMISHYQGACPEFPKGGDLDYCMGDYLEDKVDDKYFLSPERLKGLIWSNEKEKEKHRGYRFDPKTKRNPTAAGITSKAGSRKTDNFIIEREREYKNWLDSQKHPA